MHNNRKFGLIIDSKMRSAVSVCPRHAPRSAWVAVRPATMPKLGGRPRPGDAVAAAGGRAAPAGAPGNAAKKSLLLAYVLLLLGGTFGLHHWYLGRRAQALLWLYTGGGFGQGVLRDLVRLPAYVAEANGARGALEAHKALVAKHPERPPAHLSHVYFQLLAGMWAYMCVRLWSMAALALAGLNASFQLVAVDGGSQGKKLVIEEEASAWSALSRGVAGLACGCAVWAVGSVGRRRCSLAWVALPAAAVAALSALGDGGGAANPGSVLAFCFALFFWFRTRRWHLAGDGRQALSGWAVVGVVLTVAAGWLLLLALALRRFDIYVTDESQGNSSSWELFTQIWEQLRSNGFDSERWQEWGSERARGAGGMSAREARGVLGGLGSDASSTVVRKAHRDLSREWHPDKWHGDADKLAEAESMQVKLNLAKDVLLARAKPSTRVGASEWDADEL